MDAVDQAAREAKAAWPQLELPLAVFRDYLEARLPSGVARERLPSWHTSDLYLACACAHGDVRALQAFESQHLSKVGSYLDRGSPASFASDVRSALRSHLFVADAGQEPKIASYTGRGPLGGWVRVVAVRIARNLRRKDWRYVSMGPRESDLPTGDPEIDWLKGRYASPFREALEAAIGQLPRDQRTVLRMHFVDGRSVREIGALYRVAGSTVSRWVARAREQILQDLGDRLRTRLQLSESELESLARFVESRLEVSITRLLR